jgi:multiple sugar transport system permease protein
MTTAVVASIPTTMILVAAQRYIAAGATTGASRD